MAIELALPDRDWSASQPRARESSPSTSHVLIALSLLAEFIPYRIALPVDWFNIFLRAMLQLHLHRYDGADRSHRCSKNTTPPAQTYKDWATAIRRDPPPSARMDFCHKVLRNCLVFLG